MDTDLLTLRESEVKRGLRYNPQNTQALGQSRAEMVPCFDASDDVVVEWRAATVGFLDMLLPEVNKLLGLDGKEKGKTPLSLAQMLEAGTWKGGRELAAMQRPKTSGPPIMILSDGTVF